MRRTTGWGRLALIAACVAALPASVSLAAEPQILGKVTDRDGAVVADAMVFLTPVNRMNGSLHFPTRTLRSDQEGAFYAALPAGRYRIAAVKSGYDVAMTDIHSRARGVLNLQMSRSSGLSPGGRPLAPAGEELGTGWILRQQRDNVLRAARPVLADATGRRAEVRPDAIAARDGGWAAALFAPLDGRFVQQFSGGPPFAGDGEAPIGRTTALSLAAALTENSLWRFDGSAGRTFAEVGDAGSHLEDRSNRAAVGLDYRLGARDTLAGDLQYGARRYAVDSGGALTAGTEQEQRAFAWRSRWERQVDSGTSLFVEGEYSEIDARLPAGSVAGTRIADRYWSAASGLAMQAGDHSIDLGMATQHYDYDLWDEGVLLYGRASLPGPGIDPGAGPAFSLSAADRWRTGVLTTVSYGLRYHHQPGSGAAYVVPRVGMTLTPPGPSGVVLRSELLYRLDGDSGPGVAGGGERTGGDGERLGYRIGIERPSGGSDDRLHLAASYSFRPFTEQWTAGGRSAYGLASDGMPLVLGDGATSHHEVEVEMAHAFGAFRGGLAGTVGVAEGRLAPAMDEAPVQLLTAGEARYYHTQLWAACLQTDTEVRVDYRRVLAEERPYDSGTAPSDYRRLDLVVYQQIPGPRALGDARLRVLMAYQGFDYDSLYDGPAGSTVSGRSSRLTGGLDISF